MRWMIAPAILFSVVSTAPAQLRPIVPTANNPAAAAPLAIPDTIHFDPGELSLKQVDSRWQIWTAPIVFRGVFHAKQLLKDFGLHEREANEALRLIRELHFTQYGVVEGSMPPFEFWLCDDEVCKRGFGAKNVVPFNRQLLRAEEVAGAWVIHDEKQLLYNFGKQQDAALQALTVLTKYHFNALGLVGDQQPEMSYLLVDPYSRVQGPPKSALESKGVLYSVSQQVLTLPDGGYMGRRVPVDYRRLENLRFQGEWVVACGKEIVGHFGPDAVAARDALHLMQEAHITEMCLVGKMAFPVFLSNGQAPRPIGLGFNNMRVQPAQLKVQPINNIFCLTEGPRIIMEFGDNRADAELVLKVFQHFQFDQICPLGDLNHGGIRFLMKSK